MAQGCLKPIVTGFAAFFALAFFLEPAVSFAKANHREGSLGVIVEKDLFRPSRNKPRPPKAAPKPPPAPVVVLPPPKSPPPRLTLSGTILLDSGSEALMSLQSQSGSGRYRVGDEIEGFVITDILGESVVLKREDEVLKVYMNSGQGGFQNASGFPQTRQNIAVQSGPPSDIPPALVPRPQSPFQRAPYRQNTGNR